MDQPDRKSNRIQVSEGSDAYNCHESDWPWLNAIAQNDLPEPDKEIWTSHSLTDTDPSHISDTVSNYEQFISTEDFNLGAKSSAFASLSLDADGQTLEIDDSLHHEKAIKTPRTSVTKKKSKNQAKCTMPVQLTEWLYMSDANTARKLPLLLSHGITHVLNVAGFKSGGITMSNGQLATEALAEAGIAYKCVRAKDDEGYPMLSLHLEECRAFIAESRSCSSGKCLVHCMAGINRSGCIVAAELLMTCQRNILEVMSHCRSKRGNCFLRNAHFQSQLVALARMEGLLGPNPEYQNRKRDCHMSASGRSGALSKDRASTNPTPKESEDNTPKKT